MMFGVKPPTQGLTRRLLDVKVKWNDRHVGEQLALRRLHQRPAPGRVPLCRRLVQQCVVRRIAVARIVLAVLGVHELGESVGVVVVADPARTEHLGDDLAASGSAGTPSIPGSAASRAPPASASTSRPGPRRCACDPGPCCKALPRPAGCPPSSPPPGTDGGPPHCAAPGSSRPTARAARCNWRPAARSRRPRSRRSPSPAG